MADLAGVADIYEELGALQLIIFVEESWQYNSRTNIQHLSTLLTWKVQNQMQGKHINTHTRQMASVKLIVASTHEAWIPLRNTNQPRDM